MCAYVCEIHISRINSHHISHVPILLIPCHSCSQKGDGELAGTSFGAEFRCGSFWRGLGGSIPSSENRFSKKKHWSGQVGSREVGNWKVFQCPKWVAVARYRLSMGGNESYGCWEAFGTPPEPPGGHKKFKNPRKPRKSGFPGSAA